ncbi:MAG: tetratricopeptide repeat protein [bacterium]|nr:tetratricopeptide repeat protein [bacterium]
MPPTNKLNYSLLRMGSDDFDCEASRADFEDAVAGFRARVPQGFWSVIEPVEQIYEARCKSDTAALIAAYRALNESNGGRGDGNKRTIAELLIRTGHAEEGIELMKDLVGDGTNEATAFHHLNNSYLLGLAYKEIGNNKAAKEYFQEVLKFWDGADYQIEQIVKSRAMLAELTG